MSDNNNQEHLPVVAGKPVKAKFEMSEWWNQRSTPEQVVMVTILGVLAIGAFAGFVFVFMAIWNAIVPQVFGIVALNYWQALGIMVLSWIVFGGVGSSSNNSRSRRSRGKKLA